MEQQPLRDKRGLTEEEYLAQYKPSAYERPSVTVDILLFTIQDGQLKLLLVRRKNHPYLGCWALPGGFVDIHESLDAAVCRELAEETNLASDVYFEQLYTFGDVDRDPRMRVITCAYLGLTPASNIRQTQAGDDAQDAAYEARRALSRFRTELADVSSEQVPDVELGDFAVFADYFFDGLFADLFVQSRIREAQEQVEAVTQRVERLIVRLRDERENLEEKQGQLDWERERLLTAQNRAQLQSGAETGEAVPV